MSIETTHFTKATAGQGETETPQFGILKSSKEPLQRLTATGSRLR